MSVFNPAVVSTFWNFVNHGPSTAGNVVLVVTLPAGTSLTSAFVQAGLPSCTFDGSSREVTCAIGAMDSGGTNNATVLIANTGNPAGTLLTVQARVTSDTPDPVDRRQQRGGLHHTAGRSPPDGAGRSIRQSGTVSDSSWSHAAWSTTDRSAYAWNLFNAGPDQAEGVTVVFTLPEGVSYIGANIAARTAPCPFDPTTREVTCTLPGTFGSGIATSAFVQFSLDGVAAGTPITVVATVRSTTVDPDLTDNVRPNTLGGAPPPAGIPATGNDQHHDRVHRSPRTRYRHRPGRGGYDGVSSRERRRRHRR